MLVLSRKVQESIRIGPDITVTIVEVSGRTVRLGVVAPDDVSILRTELAGRQSVLPAAASPAAESSVASE